MDIRILQKACIEKDIKIALAESCTGGSIAALITSIADSSKYFLGSIVAYSDEMKVKFLDVPKEMIAEHTAVSPLVAHAMVKGVIEQTKCDIGCSITGYADGEEAPGLVYCAIGTKEEIEVLKISGITNLDRKDVIKKCVDSLIENLYETVVKGEVVLANK